jgi:hypothetical protein
MAGVRLATGYVEISAETSKVPQQLQDALSKAGTQAAKPVGEQIGKDLSTGIQQGMRQAPTPSGGGSILSDVIAGKSIGSNARTQGQKVGKEVATGINEGMTQGGQAVGKQINDQITKEAKPKEAGKQVGKDIGDAITDAVDKALKSDKGPKGAIKDLGKDAVDQLKQGAKDWGTQLAKEALSGDVQGAFTKVGDVVQDTTKTLNDLSKHVGLNLDSVEHFGRDAAQTLDGVGEKIQPWADKFKKVTGDISGVVDSISQIGSGDTQTKLQAVSNLVGGIGDGVKNLTGADITGITTPLQTFVDSASGIAQLKDSFEGLGPAILAAASPEVLAAAAAIAAVAGSGYGLYKFATEGGPLAAGSPWLQSAVPIKPGVEGIPIPGQPAAVIPPGAPPGQAYVATPGDVNDAFSALLPPGWTLQNGQLIPPGGAPVGAPAAAAGVGTGVVNAPVPATPLQGPAPPPATAPARLTAPLPTAPVPVSIAPTDMPGTTATTPLQVAPAPAAPAAAAPSGPITTQSISVNASTASVSAGSVTVSGGSVATGGGAGASVWHGPGSKPYFQSGGGIPGSDGVPIIAHGGEHMLTDDDVKAMGGQAGVYDFRKALHYDDGGAVGSDAVPPAGGGETPDWLKQAADRAGMTPEQYSAVMAHTPPGGAPGLPGPGGDSIGQQQQDMQANIFGQTGGQAADQLAGQGRTEGFIPSGAGSKAVAGTSFVAGILNLGNEAVAGLIDQGASAAEAAISAAATAGSFGAGGEAAGPASQILIGIAASEGKRAVSYGFQVASIAADALIDQVFGPFGGPPRWLGYDYTQFVPHINFGAIGTTTTEKAVQEAMKQGKGGKPGEGQEPGGPVEPEHLGGAQPVGPPVPKFGQPAAPQELGGLGLPKEGKPGATPPGGVEAGIQAGEAGQPGPAQPVTPETPGPPPAPEPAPPPPAPPPSAGMPFGGIFSSLGIMDEGGVLNDKSLAANTSGRPELVLSPQQMDAMSPMLDKNHWNKGGDTNIFHVTNPEAVGRELDKRKRLAMMQYSGRP